MKNPPKRRFSTLPLLVASMLASISWTSTPAAGQQAIPAYYAQQQGNLVPANPAVERLPSHPDAPRLLTLEDLQQLALVNNPAMAQAQANVNAAEGNWRQAGLPPNLNLGYSGQQLGSGGVAEQQGVYIRQRIVALRKLRLNREVAGQQIERAEQLWAAQRQRVLTDVRLGFYDIIAAQRRLAIAGELVTVSERAVRVADALFQSQEGNRIDLLQARIEADSTINLLDRSQDEHLAAWRALVAVLGLPDFPSQPLAGGIEEHLPQLNWDDTLQRLLTESPEIAAAMAEMERAHWAYHRSRAEVIPDVNVQAVFQRDNGTGSGNGNLQVSLPIPLWNRNQGGIQQAESQWFAAERSLERVQLDLRRRLADVFGRYNTARSQVARYRNNILPNAKQNLDLVRNGYEAREFAFLNLLTAQRTYFETNMTYLDALRNMWRAATEIDGLLLKESLRTMSP